MGLLAPAAGGSPLRGAASLLLILLACGACRGGRVIDDDYSVYHDLLSDLGARARAGGQSVRTCTVFSVTSALEDLGADDRRPLEPGRVAGHLPGLQPSTLESYNTRFRERRTLDAGRFQGLSIALLRPQEWRAFSRGDFGGSSWEAFRASRPEDFGILELSPVGFSADRAQAFVHLVRYTSPRDHAGCYYLLGLDGGMWRVRQEWRDAGGDRRR